MSADDKADAAWDDYVSQQQEEKIEELQRELNAANQRIKRLENIIFRASTSFFEDGSDRFVAVAMLMILDEAKEAKP